MGNKATKKVAKHRIDFIERNVSCYVWIHNGPQQLEHILTNNNLAALITVLQMEKDELEEKAKEEKKKSNSEKVARKAVRNQKMQDEQVELGPCCRDKMEKGLIHVLSLTYDRRTKILRINVGHIIGISKLNVAGTEMELWKYMAAAQ
jgi:hypothetical protein